jgi:deoxyribodipyrimidine photo-lyase
MLRSIARQRPPTLDRTARRHLSTAKMAPSNLLIYLLRRDLRLGDNPIFHEAIQRKRDPYTHLLPIYIFPAQQLEVSGFIPKDSDQKSPYPEARSAVGGFWRCGPHRAKFLCESVWDLKESLEGVGSGLEIRVGMIGEVINKILEGVAKESKGEMTVSGLWMAGEEGVEEKSEEKDVRDACAAADVEFRVFTDEKYFVDE